MMRIVSLATALMMVGALGSAGCKRRRHTTESPQGLVGANMQPGMQQPGTLPGMQPGTLPAGTQAMAQQPGAAGGKLPTAAATPPPPQLSTGGTPNYGVRQVSPGFVPDPIDVSIVSGGSLDTRSMGLGAGCVGFVTTQPDFNIQLSAADTMLRLYVTSDSDTTLVVNDAAGGWHCNDDSNGGHNPMVDLRNTPAGLINVWVGSYQSGVQARGVLHVSELASNHP